VDKFLLCCKIWAIELFMLCSMWPNVTASFRFFIFNCKLVVIVAFFKCCRPNVDNTEKLLRQKEEEVSSLISIV